MSLTPARRDLVKGGAWAAPVILASSVVPAYAASMCQPTVRFSGGMDFKWGAVGSTSTTQKLDIGGQTWVDNLPAGVTVETIAYQFTIQNRDGQQSPGPGFFYVGNGTSDRASQPKNAMPWTPTAGSGFANTVSNTYNFQNRTYVNGQTAPSWDLNMNWSASRDTLKQYTAGSTGCQNFTTGPSSRFAVNYTGVVGPRSTADMAVLAQALILVTLSDGTVLRYQSNILG